MEPPNNGKEHPHRSKSQLAKSILHRDKSKHDVRDTEEKDFASSGTPSASQSNVSLSSQPAPSRSSVNLASKRISKHRPHLSTNNMLPQEGGPSSAASSSAGVNSPPSPTATSLEQSVKLFRLFEALRAGDTAAIQKALKDQPSHDADLSQSRSSISSVTPSAAKIEGTSILHLAIQCAEVPTIQYVLSHSGSGEVNSRDREGNTALHVAAKLGRAPVVALLLEQEGINDSIHNFHGQTPLDVSYTPEIFQQLQLFRSLFVDANVRKIHELVAQNDHTALEALLKDPRLRSTVDVNGGELATDPITIQSGGTLLHEAARKKDVKLIQMLLLNGADPFRRDRKGKLPQDVTKDDRTRAILKKSPAAAEARQGIQEKSILGSSGAQTGGPAANDIALGNKEGREMKGYLKKWTNYTSGWKLRWFVLEDGVLSYYKHQEDVASACRGAINMRIAKLNMDPQDKLKFEILGKSSVKYHLKANHEVEAKRWYWALNNAIQFTKDEAREDEKRQKSESDALRQAKIDQINQRKAGDGDAGSLQSSQNKRLIPSTAVGVPLTATQSIASTAAGEQEPSLYEPSVAGAELGRMVSEANTATIEGDVDDEEEYGDDASSHEAQPETKDALNITAQSVKLQLEFLGQVSRALHAERKQNPTLQISDPTLGTALSTYESSVGTLKDLVGKLLQISRDRDSYWQYRLDREANVRRMWEESMAKVAMEQEQLEQKIGESEDKRKRTKRALRDALGSLAVAESQPGTPAREVDEYVEAEEEEDGPLASPRRRPTIADLTGVSDSDSDNEEEFFDAVGSGEVEVVEMPPTSPGLKPEEQPLALGNLKDRKMTEISPSFKGYEDPIRKRLKLDADNRPKIGLWGILKSMIGKDMTKMTLPVSFNEPTSLLQRVAEDMEYTDLLDIAAERLDSTERMVYVAAFAASEYASTIGRVAKPFNPLLGETYEYARPDKGYRFFIEQVSHHPPIGAAWAESPNWDYYGESAVRSKFYGKSFDINPLGTWYLRLRPSTGGEELYTWKKVTSSVIGIITGNPTVDNYGIMEVKNWNTGEICTLDFKPRGWKASSAFQVAGRVLDKDGKTRWSVGGRWNDKIYARLTPGYEDNSFDHAKPSQTATSTGRNDTMSSSQAFLVWQANSRPTGIPFNLTPFGLTLNAIPDSLRPHLAPTDTRLRPDQRAMEDGEYDFAAVEKNRVEEKQRANRRVREQMGEEFIPRWFEKSRCETTGEEFWKFNGEYWTMRKDVGEKGGEWKGLEDIF